MAESIEGLGPEEWRALAEMARSEAGRLLRRHLERMLSEDLQGLVPPVVVEHGLAEEDFRFVAGKYARTMEIMDFLTEVERRWREYEEQ